ncbi:hypothetical protein [Streptomyces sp. NPDC048473]|uniref:hypothetical protein n=1 Tax=unclassified Streptomyces TaxID=2593676 RepID=UPI003714E09F
MMKTPRLLAVAALTAGLTAAGISGANAVDDARHSISIVAHVPTNGFYVVPTDYDLGRDLTITAARPSGYAPGDYTGTVVMTFDAVPPVGG